jgi:hypothetical protein
VDVEIDAEGRIGRVSAGQAAAAGRRFVECAWQGQFTDYRCIAIDGFLSRGGRLGDRWEFERRLACPTR